MKAVLFDFFGTLVEYQPDRSQLGSPETHEFARSLGFVGDHDAFVTIWDTASSALEDSARATLREFSMTDAAMAFGAATQVDLDPIDAERLGRSYVVEWSRHLRPVSGVADMVGRLAAEFTIAVVSNTHDAEMVPNLLNEMGVSDDISAVVLSVEHGWCKPHRSIYAAALGRVGCGAEHSVFVGDSHEADYLGPLDAGMTAFLIGPSKAHDVPAAARLTSVLEIEYRLDDLADRR